MNTNEYAPVPLTITEVFATTFRTMGAHAGRIVLLTSAVVIPTTVLTVAIQAIQYYFFGGAALGSREAIMGPLVTLAGMIPIALLSWLAGIVVQGAILHFTLETLQGRTATFREALDAVRPRYLALLGVSFLVALITMVGVMLCFVPGFIAMVLLSAAIPACFSEHIGPLASLKRSVELTEGRRLTLFFIYVVLVVGLGTLFCCVMSPAMVSAYQQAQDAAQRGLAAAQNPLAPLSLLSNLLSMGLQVVIMGFMSTLVAVLYTRLRGLRDNIDAHRVAQVFQ